MSDECRQNTDRELWRSVEGDYYADSLFVTEAGGIGINVGGNVRVMSLRGWHSGIAELDTLRTWLREAQELAIDARNALGKASAALRTAIRALEDEEDQDRDIVYGLMETLAEVGERIRQAKALLGVETVAALKAEEGGESK